jgi:phosphonate transport system permease protein
VTNLQDALTGMDQLTDRAVGSASSLPVRPLTKEKIVIRLLLLVLALTTIYTLTHLDTGGVNLAQAVSDTLVNLKIIFLTPGGPQLSFLKALYEVVITLGLAFLATVFGAFVALFLGLLGAQNLAPKPVTNVIKAVVAFIRAVPTILWVLIFAVTAGLGATPAVIGMTFHSISYLTKAYAESFEDLDRSVIEALKASGANWWQIVFQAVIPSSSTYLLSWTFLRFEMNFATAVVVGAAAGASGVGFDLYMASDYYFDLREVGLITYLILAFSIVLETIATRMKSRIKDHQPEFLA